MSSKRYAEEFKIEAVKQITERGHSVYEVVSRLGTTTHSLYAWCKKYGNMPTKLMTSKLRSSDFALN